MEVRHTPATDNSSVPQQQQQRPSPSKQPKPSPNPVDTSSVSQRLQKELMSLMIGGLQSWRNWVEFFPWNGICIVGFSWKDPSYLEFDSEMTLSACLVLQVRLGKEGGTVAVRVGKENKRSLMSSGDIGVSAFPEGESIFAWLGTIEGGKGTMYEGLSYKLSLRFPLDYPFKPPQVKFETMCFHPNVDQFGNICLDILQDKWSSAYDCRTILLSIQSLLGEPNTESPLNSYAATLWQNKEDYKKMVHKHYFDGEAIES
ncbi:hypothetical protein RHSIM_Rhsim09G0152800 [Rhododendron simsii]|uniref:E2 ubiquitin-conjugating enzyme n=1 Tax=Rhododendron simsii TaxID=118357 RepID=A0A834GCF0_RHOSS|nr:hypothetical protein RHSIM_Rhsim09G0152800 [Rhododendron simsii]